MSQEGANGHSGRRRSERRPGKDYESIAKAFGRGVIVARRDVEVDAPILTVPAGVLLALLG